jgi:hypothetical protein
MENVTGQQAEKPLTEIPENERKVAGQGATSSPSRSAHSLELRVGDEQLIPDSFVR